MTRQPLTPHQSARRIEPPSRVAALRAIGLTALAVAAAAATWQLRPSAHFATSTPSAAIVGGCAWLVWILAGYLAVATGAASLGHLLSGVGRIGGALSRLAPSQLRRIIEAVVTTSVAATIVGSVAAAPATAATRPVAVSERAPLVAGSPLDWPGLTARPHQQSTHQSAPTHRRAPTTPPRRHHPHADVGPVGGVRPGGLHPGQRVVVERGDTLWSLAARQLGPGASGAAITEAWHAWHDTNRTVIGPDPGLIRPGQQLRTPALHHTATRTP